MGKDKERLEIEALISLIKTGQISDNLCFVVKIDGKALSLDGEDCELSVEEMRKFIDIVTYIDSDGDSGKLEEPETLNNPQSLLSAFKAYVDSVNSVDPVD